MSSLFGNLAIASSALSANRQGMSAVGSDVANAATPGYHQEVTAFLPNAQGGVTASNTRVSDPPAAQAILSALGTNGGATGQYQLLSVAQSIFPGAQSGGIQGALDQFWSAWQSLANDPTSLPARNQVLTQAGVVSAQFNSISQALGQLVQQAQGQQATQVAQVNSILKQLGQLNQQIGASPAGSGRDALENKQSNLLQTLGGLVGVQGLRQANGTLALWNGGEEIVSGNGTTDTLAIPSGSAPMWSSGVAATGGAVGGVNTARSQISGYVAELNALANSVISGVNTAQIAGFDLAGHAGLPLFIGASAATMGVNSAVGANQLAASSSGAEGDGSNAQTIADLGGAGVGSIAQQIASTTSQIGADVAQAQSDQTASAQGLANLQKAGAAIWGVNTDQAGILMVEEQRAYQAAATYTQALSQMMQTLVQL